MTTVTKDLILNQFLCCLGVIADVTGYTAFLTGSELEIPEYAQCNAVHVDNFIEILISSRKHRRARRIEKLLYHLGFCTKITQFLK